MIRNFFFVLALRVKVMGNPGLCAIYECAKESKKHQKDSLKPSAHSELVNVKVHGDGLEKLFKNFLPSKFLT